MKTIDAEVMIDGKDCIVLTSVLHPGTENARKTDDIHAYRVPDCRSKREAIEIVFEYGGGDYEGVQDPAVRKMFNEKEVVERIKNIINVAIKKSTIEAYATADFSSVNGATHKRIERALSELGLEGHPYQDVALREFWDIWLPVEYYKEENKCPRNRE
jgi:hypothetical protein